MASFLSFQDRCVPIDSVYAGTSCAFCMNVASDDATSLFRCSQCKRAHYCSKSCQQKDWNNVHKTECALLVFFQKNYKRIPGTTVFDKAEAMKNLFEKTPKWKTCYWRSWNRLEQFLQQARVCSICQKSEYDFADSRRWMNCPTCRYGWCCSEEHWSEYKSQHTQEICDCYTQFDAVSRFQWHQEQSEGEFFARCPGTVRRTVMKTFPTSWDEYFSVRSPRMYQLRNDGTIMLPPEFFPASTDKLSQSLTCLFAMYEHGIRRFKNKKTLTIHIVGASPDYEVMPTCVWEEIVRCLPALNDLKLAFVGPEACNVETIPKSFASRVTVAKGRTVSYSMVGKTYHVFAASTDFSTPDLVVGFSPGLCGDVKSWRQSVRSILDLNVPCTFTANSKGEADRHYSVLAGLFEANMLNKAPVLNPVAVQTPLPPTARRVSKNKVDLFLYRNQYCLSFKGKL